MPDDRDGGRSGAPPGLGALRAVRRPSPLAVAGVASLANGAALLLYILGRVPMPALLAFTWSIAILALATMGALSESVNRARLRTYVAVGFAAGIVATLAYDLTKTVLSQLDPSPFNPFEATRVFGTILIGPDAPPVLIAIVGWAFHITNGCTFAIAFGCLFARAGRVSMRRGILTGMGWGLFLETFQLALYPGWLNIKFLDEFRQISFLSHLVFGATLGILVPAGLRWQDRRVTIGGPGER